MAYKYTDDDLIKIIQEKYKELGRVPRRREIKQNGVIRTRFGSWNNALIKAGLIPSRSTEKLTQEDCIKLIRKKAKELGRTPYAREWNEDKTLPCTDTVRKVFNNKTWYEIVQIAGLKPIYTDLRVKGEHLFNQLSDEEVLKRLKNELERLNTTYKSVYDSNKSKDMPTSDYLKQRLTVNSWGEILLKLGYPEDCVIIKEYTDEELIKALQDYYEKTGLNPSITVMESLGYCHHTFTSHFGSFNNALIIAGLEVNQESTTVTHSNEELLEMYKDLCKRLGRAATSTDIEEYLPYKSDVFSIRFGGLQNLRELSGFPDNKIRPKKYTKKEIKDKLIKQYKLHGRRLTNSEIQQLSNEIDDFPAQTTILRYFNTTSMTKVWGEIEQEINSNCYLHELRKEN